jgi:hypothetical protein
VVPPTERTAGRIHGVCVLGAGEIQGAAHHDGPGLKGGSFIELEGADRTEPADVCRIDIGQG